MSARRNLESRKTELGKINETIKEKGKQVEELENSYDKAYDKRMDVENNEGIDEEVKEPFRRESSEKFRELEQKGKELSDSLQDEMEKAQDLYRENQEAIEANARGMKAAHGFDSILKSNTAEKFESHEKILEGFSEEITEAKKDAAELARRASYLNTHRGMS